MRLLLCCKCEAEDCGGGGGEVDELPGGMYVSLCVHRVGNDGLFTRWFVMMALPSLHLTEKGSWPGKGFGVCSVNAVRGGEVKRVFSRGRGTKV